MYKAKEKIPTDNKNQTLLKVYQILFEYFPNLILDIRPEKVVDWPTDDRSNYDEVFYKTLLQNGSKKCITEPSDYFDKFKKTSILQFLQFVKGNNPEKILKVICRWDSDNDEYELTEFYDEDMRVKVRPSSRLFGGYHVKIEIQALDQYREKMQLMIDKMKHSNGSDESKQAKEPAVVLEEGPEQLIQEFKDRKNWKI